MENRELGPYRATKLWNEVIHLFRTGMPLKRHRRHMRCYEYCFSASEAVNWMHQQLLRNPNFKSDITRDQTIQLLNKFFKNGVFEELKRSKSKIHQEEFKDNSDLYRFTTKEFATAAIHRPFGYGNRSFPPEKTSECQPVIKHMSEIEIEDLWKTTVINRIQSLLRLQSIEEILSDEDINTKFIVSNMSQSVMCRSSSQDLPHWIISAMKCLATWPYAKGKSSCLPSYPGFEKDVFRVIRDHFQNFERPLISDKLSDALIKAFGKSEDLEFESVTQRSAPHNYRQLASFESVENLMLNMTLGDMGDTNNIQKTSTPQGTISKIENTPNLGISEIVENKHAINNGIKINPLLISQLPPNTCFETAFTSASPVTRIIPQQNYTMQRKHPSENVSKHYSMEITTNQSSFNQDRSIRTIPANVNSTSHSYPSLTENKLNCVEYNKSSHSNICQTLSKSSGYLNLGFLSDKEEEEDDQDSQCSSYYTADSHILTTNIQHCDEPKILNTEVEDKCCDVSYHTAISDDVFESDSNESESHSSKLSANGVLSKSFTTEEIVINGIPKTFTQEGRTRTIEVIQLICLLLPPINRQILYMLLRLMVKVSANGNVKLHSTLPNRIIMLRTFTYCILFTRLQTQKKASELVAFLMDNSEEIFVASAALKSQINSKLISISSEKMQYILDNPCTITYCEQVTKQEYEFQRQWNSEQALVGLLERIIQDPQISVKERRKRLKQVSNYVLLYKEYRIHMIRNSKRYVWLYKLFM